MPTETPPATDTMTPTLFSISYAGFWGQASLSLEQFIPKAAELGYRSVMLAGKRPNLSPLDTDAQRIDELRGLLRSHDVQCSVIAGYTDFSSPVSEVPYVEFQIQYVESLARIARELGAGVVRVFSAYHLEGSSEHADWPRMTRIMQEVCDRCAVYDVTVAMQNHHDFAVSSPALLDFLGDVNRPNFRLGFDAWSPALRGEQLYKVAREAAPYTAITTNADYVRFPQFRFVRDRTNYERDGVDVVRAVPFGDGFIDYDAFFSGLRDGGFDGISTYEMCTPLRGGGCLDNLDRCAKRFLEWNREHGLISET